MKNFIRSISISMLAVSLTACATTNFNRETPDNALQWSKKIVDFSMGENLDNQIFRAPSYRNEIKLVPQEELSFVINDQGVVEPKMVKTEKEILVKVPIKNRFTGKRPAVILLHSCAGITPFNAQSLKNWTKLLTDNGYIVLSMNHLSPRGAGNNCNGKNRAVTERRMAIDVADAVAHLSSMPEVDARRIFSLGFSLGGQVNGLVASKDIHESWLQNRSRPRAVASVYGGCRYPNGMNYLPYDASLPVLWLMGGQDTESPADGCTSQVKHIKEKIPTSDWHVYPEATHCWDCVGLNGYTKTANNGNRVTYWYDEQVTNDSMKRVLDFFNKFQ